MKISFPHFGNAYIAGKVLLEECGHTVITPPVCSRSTLELGTSKSPESMCMPFKIFIGNYIESIQRGADTILLTGSCGPCRYGFYSYMQKDIIKKLGYDVDFIVLESFKEGIPQFSKNIKRLIGSVSPNKLLRSSRLALKLIKSSDDLTCLSNEVRAYAIDKDKVNFIMDSFYKDADDIHGFNQLQNLINDTERQLRTLKINRNFKPLRVGLIGDIYTIIEPFINLEVERKLGYLGVIVEKSLTPTKWLEHHILSYPFGSKFENEKYSLARPYIKDMIGGHGRETVGSAIYYRNKGFDGAIQILPLNCMPEIVAKSVLKRVVKDIDFPVMTLVVDEMTGEAGFNTRLEAYVDLLYKRRRGEMIIG
ncbi:CoA protein activase [Tissierella creatinini]|nr:CoA protein activase [Tissierella creatinini]TJX62778.1 CoA protein activase [Soehngenia saccharolytica]